MSMNEVYYFESDANQEKDVLSFGTLGYVPYLSLIFSLIATAVILLLSGWVVYTIKTTTSLHKPYNVFVANLLVSDMIVAVLIFTIQCSMMISYQFGVKLFVSCYAYKFVMLCPLLVCDFSVVILACDRVVALMFPSMYQRTETHRVEAAIISGAWFLAVVPAIVYTLVFDVDGVIHVPEYGVCAFKQNAYIYAVYNLIPTAVVSFLSIILYALLIIKALQFEAEKKFDSIVVNTTLKTELFSIKLEGKLLNMLFVIILAPYLCRQVTFLWRLANSWQVHQHLMIYAVVPNITYVIQFLHALVFVLYFKQAHQPLSKHFVGLKPVNTVNPCAAVV